ncbi:MAG: hypothetical protein NTU80_05830 [Verrucomicrobia bacterium]|nr:hypothetical protein [Verrucomicrobiota bacterium]
MARLTDIEKAQLLAAAVVFAEPNASLHRVPPPSARRPALGLGTYFAQLDSWQRLRPAPPKPINFSGDSWRL